MEDDIDIEEHDVLEHPRIRNIFPDITQIKTEVPDDDYEDETTDYAPYSDTEAADNEDFSTHRDDRRHGNKIILGSKPNHSIQERDHNGDPDLFGQQQITIKEELDINYECEEIPEDAEEEVQASSSVIIVGNKPSLPYYEHIQTNSLPEDDNEEDKDCEEQSNNADDNEGDTQVSKDDIKDSVVLLENWGPRLESSSCYCKDCQILFPTTNTLEVHNMTAHSFLIAVNTNKAVKSTARGNKAHASQSTPDNGRFCNHCQKIFPDPDSLINHLYKNLSFDENNPILKVNESAVPAPQKVLVTPPKIIVKKDESKVIVNKPLQPKDQESVKDCNHLQCRICGCFFKRMKLYIRHMNNFHLRNDIDTRRVPYDGNCPHCKAYIKTDLNNHIYKTHHSIFNAKGKSIQKLIPKPPTESSTHYKFKCMRCHEIFPNYYATRNHRLSKHPSVKERQNLFVKIMTTSTAPSFVAKKVVLPPKLPKKQLPTQIADRLPITNSPIPKSVLYKCERCPLHFTSCTVAIIHSKHCLQHKDAENTRWKCQICHRYFKVGDRLIHQVQHQHTFDFNVHVCEENIYGKVLNECPKCGLYFCEKKFFSHVKAECKGASIKCENCSLPIHVSTIEEHNDWHQMLDLTKQDLILVEYIKQNNMKVGSEVGVKRKLTEEAEPSTSAKRQKVVANISEKLKMYYCQYCSCYFVGVRHMKTHEQEKCRTKSLLSKKRICKTCGLMCSASSHFKIHEMYPELTIFDIRFVSVVGRRTIIPPMPIFPQCSKCAVYFCRVTTVVAHKCTDSYNTCHICTNSFSDLAFKLHMRFHEYSQRFRGPKTVATYTKRVPPQASGSQQTVGREMPELLKKYEMLTDIWKILYLCKTCDILYDTYDRAVDHCQKHFNNMESYDVTVKHCVICDLKFDSVCFNKHKELHEWNNKIKKGSFQIINFVYTELFTPKWLDMFSTLANVPKKQILSGSIYYYNRGVKLRVLKNGPSEAVVYRCAKCDLHVYPASLADHVVLCNGNGEDKFVCALKNCGLQFCGPLARDMHQGQHKLAKTFKTVLFNEERDKEFNETLRRNNVGTQTKTKSNKAGRFHYYQCTKCKCCSEILSDKTPHRCHYGTNRKRCETCKLFFVKRHTKHETLHKTVRLNRKMIKITPFTPKTIIAQKYKPIASQKIKTIVRLYKCECGLHFTSTKAIERHSESCSEGAEISKEKCSKCNRLFDTTQLVTHLCKHHSNEKNTTFEVVVWNKSKDSDSKHAVIQCSDCESLFCSKHAFSVHETTCGSNNTFCSTCGLKFHSPLTHQLRHKDCTNLSIEDYDITITVPVKDKMRRVYKCEKCDVYYLSYSGVMYHITDGNHDMSKVAPCPECGLNFMPKTLVKHIAVQHKERKYTRDDLIIEIVPYKADNKVDSVKKTLQIEQQNSPKSAIKEKVKAQSAAGSKANNAARQSPTEVHCSKKTLSAMSWNSYSNNLFKCHICKVHFINRYALRAHFFREKHNVKTAPCPICGYVFSIYTLDRHKYIHHVKKKLKRENFKLKSVGPVTVVDYNSDGEYGQSREVAKARDVEPMEVVDDVEDSVVDSDNGDRSDSELSTGSIDAATLSFNKKMKGQIINVENILYKCGHCTLHFLVEMTVFGHISIVHTQNTPSSNKETCQFCHLDFTDATLKKHIPMHHENQNLTKDDFHVISLTKLSEKGLSCSSIFQCNICFANFIRLYQLTEHIHTTTPHESPNFTCKHCGLRFLNSATLCRHIEYHHKFMKLKRDAVCVLQYYDEGKLLFLGPPNTDSTEDAEPTRSNDVDVANASTDVEIDTDIDVCNDSVNSVDCDDEQTTPKNAVDKTTKKKYRSLHPDVLSKIDLGLYNRNIYKCSVCSLHFIRQRGLLSHHSKRFGHTEVKHKDKCEICGLTFTELSLPSHVYIHHDQFKFTREELNIIDDIELDAKGGANETTKGDINKLYHCEICSTNFVLRDTFLKHSTSCKNTIAKSKCDICGLLFSKATLLKHRRIHHIENNFAYKDFLILNLNFEEINLREEDLTNTQQNDVENVAEDELKELTEKVSTLNTDLYTNKLYRCDRCSIHFLTADILDLHTRNDKHDVPRLTCTSCGNDFTETDLATHVVIHHDKMELAAENFEITSNSEILGDCTLTSDVASDNAISNDNSEVFNDVKSLSSDVEIVEPIIETTEPGDVDLEEKIEEDAGDISDSSIQLILDGAEGSAIDNIASIAENTIRTFESEEPHINTQPSVATEEFKDENASQDNVKSNIPLTESNGSTENEPKEQTSHNTRITSDSDKKSYKIKLYKCGECNVCFLTQRNCYKHVLKHTPLDQKDYIECKLCGFQFLIFNSLGNHITKHHREPFKLEEVLVEEYHPNVICHGTPKIELYNGIDKIQSKLVSTTSEGNVSSDFDSENEKDVSRTSDTADDVDRMSLDDIVVLD